MNYVDLRSVTQCDGWEAVFSGGKALPVAFMGAAKIGGERGGLDKTTLVGFVFKDGQFICCAEQEDFERYQQAEESVVLDVDLTDEAIESIAESITESFLKQYEWKVSSQESPASDSSPESSDSTGSSSSSVSSSSVSLRGRGAPKAPLVEPEAEPTKPEAEPEPARSEVDGSFDTGDADDE